jgi:hypothetical protein
MIRNIRYIHIELDIFNRISFNSSKNVEAVSAFEKMLFPVFDFILKRDVQGNIIQHFILFTIVCLEFEPYLFQIMSLLLEITPDGLSQDYMQILPPLLTSLLWERSANVSGK